MSRSTLRTIVAALLVGAIAHPAVSEDPPALVPPAPEVISQARAIVAAMKAAPRGPYQYLRWVCADGSMLPPTPYACKDLGGGHQYGIYSSQRQELALLGYRVGTILTATPWDELFDPTQRHQRLRELAVERYLVDVDDGWVLRKARYYRGRVQIEDEEAFGRAHLLRMLESGEWLQGNYLLARELVRTLPHSAGGDDATRTMRRTAAELAEIDPSFETLRVKLHTDPAAGDVELIRGWIVAAQARGAKSTSIDTARRLIDSLQALYGSEGRAARLAAWMQRFSDVPEMRELLRLLDSGSRTDHISRLANLVAATRTLATKPSTSPARRLAAIDLSVDLESELIVSTRALLADLETPRHALLVASRHLLSAGYGTGFLTQRERDSVARPAALLPSEPAPAAYLAAAHELERAGALARAAVWHAFAEPLVRYTALEPKAALFVDDILRGSMMLPLAEIAGRLARDAERAAGIAHRIFDEEIDGIGGLNAGVAVGRLRVVGDDEHDLSSLRADEIVVLPRTVSTLPAVAGILSLSSGNVLSHVQMLARNLGIPSANCPGSTPAALAKHNGVEVLLAVNDNGSVVLQRLDRLPAVVRRLVLPDEPVIGEKIDLPTPDLSMRRPLNITELTADTAMTMVGPKAGNLAELKRLFPDRVAPAIALPFGVYAAHTEEIRARVDSAFAKFRSGASDEEELMAAVDAAFAAIQSLELDHRTAAELVPMMTELFGPPGTYGVFVRSTTNVEDLPQFTGAGLNLTIPNVVGLEPQLEAIPRVWASPFTRRALGWRKRVLLHPERAYASVLLMESVNCDKSGVLVTADVTRQIPGLTVVTAWGVGGGVSGEIAETLVLEPDGGVRLTSDAHAPYQLRLRSSGGFEWAPAPSGQVLTVAEQDVLRRFAAEVAARIEPRLDADGEPLPWDIEFGFVGGELQLFQLRPLVKKAEHAAAAIIANLAGTRTAQASISLSEPPVVFMAAGATGGTE